MEENKVGALIQYLSDKNTIERRIEEENQVIKDLKEKLSEINDTLAQSYNGVVEQLETNKKIIVTLSLDDFRNLETED